MNNIDNMDNFDNIITNQTPNGITGLINIGNTCYMNSALQCLSASTLFVSYLINKKFETQLRDNISQKLVKKILDNRQKDNINLHKYDEDGDETVSIYVKDIDEEYYNSVTYNVYKLFKSMWRNNTVIRPSMFKKTFGTKHDMFSGFEQHDSQEFINILLDEIHEETKINVSPIFSHELPFEIYSYIDKKKKLINEIKHGLLGEECLEIFINNNRNLETILKSLQFWKSYMKNNCSPIMDIFTGMTLSEIVCSECTNTSSNFEIFNILPVSIPSNDNTTEPITLQECLKEFGSTETLTDDNMYKCEKCNKLTNATKKTHIWDLPELLIIQLKRFSNNGMRYIKNNRHVNFPISNLTFTDNYHEYNIKDYKYDLYGVVYHMGSLNRGHYISYTMNPLDNKWYKYNDSIVQPIPFESIESEIMNGGSYILFYKKNIY